MRCGAGARSDDHPGHIDSAWESPQGPWLDLIYREAFRRLGYDFQLLNMPSKRASALSDTGESDGEVHRARSYAAFHPNLVIVEQPHYMAKFVAYASQPIVLAPGWDSLKGSAYRIEYRLGIQHAEEMLRQRVEAARMTPIATPEQGLQKLAFGRSDIFIDVNFNIDPLLDDPRYRHAHIHQVAVMDEIGGHAFLNRKYAALAPKLAAILLQLKQEGLIENYQKQAMQAWLARHAP